MTNSECPAFPFSDRPGIAMDPDYLKGMGRGSASGHGSETLALPTLLAGGTLFLKLPKYRSTGSRSCTRSA